MKKCISAFFVITIVLFCVYSCNIEDCRDGSPKNCWYNLKYEQGSHDNGCLSSVEIRNELYTLEVKYNRDGKIIRSSFINNQNEIKCQSIFKYYLDTCYKLQSGFGDEFYLEKRFINNKLVVDTEINHDSTRLGSLEMYYLTGKKMAEGQYLNRGLCYLNEFDHKGDLKSTKQYFELDINKYSDNKYQITSNWFAKNPIFDTIKFVYAFYQITDQSDTLNIMDNKFEEVEVFGTMLNIPFDFEAKGKYLFRAAIPQIINYQEFMILYELYFEFDASCQLANVEMFPIPIETSYHHPYSTLYSLDNNSLELLMHDSLNIVFPVPSSKYIVFSN